jgi:hypothetical protein
LRALAPALPRDQPVLASGAALAWRAQRVQGRAFWVVRVQDYAQLGAGDVEKVEAEAADGEVGVGWGWVGGGGGVATVGVVEVVVAARPRLLVSDDDRPVGSFTALRPSRQLAAVERDSFHSRRGPSDRRASRGALGGQRQVEPVEAAGERGAAPARGGVAPDSCEAEAVGGVVGIFWWGSGDGGLRGLWLRWREGGSVAVGRHEEADGSATTTARSVHHKGRRHAVLRHAP